MGLFNFGKKKEKVDPIKAKYESMTIKELETLLQEQWKVAPNEYNTLCEVYGMKILLAPKAEGGFEISKDRVESLKGELSAWVKEDGICYQYDKSGNIKAINRKLVFAGNFMRRNPSKSAYFAVIWAFETENINAMLTEEFLDENYIVYHPWVYERGEEGFTTEENFVKAKINTVIFLTDTEGMKREGYYKKLNGEFTDEFITIDDLLELKSLYQLNSFLKYHQKIK